MHLVRTFLLFAILDLIYAQTVLTTTITSAANSTTSTGTSTITSSAVEGTMFPTLGGYSSCVTEGLFLAVSRANCTSVVEVNCYCPTKRFTKGLISYISSNCPAELPTAEQLAQQFCHLTNSSTSLSWWVTSLSVTSSTASPSTLLASVSTTSTSPITTPVTTTTSNAGLNAKRPFGLGSVSDVGTFLVAIVMAISSLWTF